MSTRHEAEASPRFPLPRPAHALREALAEGYGWQAFRADALAGIVVGILALPLSMALAIASGVAPLNGLYLPALHAAHGRADLVNLESAVDRLAPRGVLVIRAGVQAQPRRVIERAGPVAPGRATLCEDLECAFAAAGARVGVGETPALA